MNTQFHGPLMIVMYQLDAQSFENMFKHLCPATYVYNIYIYIHIYIYTYIYNVISQYFSKRGKTHHSPKKMGVVLPGQIPSRWSKLAAKTTTRNLTIIHHLSCSNIAANNPHTCIISLSPSFSKAKWSWMFNHPRW